MIYLNLRQFNLKLHSIQEKILKQQCCRAQNVETEEISWEYENKYEVELPCQSALLFP